MNGDTFGDYSMGSELFNRMLNVRIYGWLNEVAALVLNYKRFIVRYF